MRTIGAAILCVVLGGGCASAQNTMPPTGTGNQFVGQNVKAVADRFGPPAGRMRLDTDETLYVWELSPPDQAAKRRRTTEGWGGRYDDGETPGYMTDDPRICKLSVIASPEGIVTQVKAEDDNGTGAPKRNFGFLGSVCADRGLAR